MATVDHPSFAHHLSPVDMANESPGFDALKALIPHIFLPLRLPQKAQEERDERDTSLLLCRLLTESAIAYKDSVPVDQQVQWNVVLKMLHNVECFVDVPMSPTSLATVFNGMNATGARVVQLRIS